MASKADWKDALQRVAGRGFGIDYLATSVGDGRLSGIKDKTPEALYTEIMKQVGDLEVYRHEVGYAKAQQVAAESRTKEVIAEAAEAAKKAKNDLRDKEFEVEDLEYENRVLKAMLMLFSEPDGLRMTYLKHEIEHAIQASKDFEAEAHSDVVEGTVSLTFLHKDEYKSPMEGIGWHKFAKDDN